MQRDVSTRFSERERDSSAQASGRSRDQRSLSLQAEALQNHLPLTSLNSLQFRNGHLVHVSVVLILASHAPTERVICRSHPSMNRPPR